MKEFELNLKSFVGMDNDFVPHYQYEKPVEFGARVMWYLEHYYDSKQPEQYMDKMKFAVQYANKSLMLEKLGIDFDQDLESLYPEEFQKAFLDIAKSYSDIVIDGDRVRFESDLLKSVEFGENTMNKAYEVLWKKTFDTILSKTRM